MTGIFLVVAIVCAFGWLNRWVACAALVKYMADKKVTPPSDDEAKACAMYVWTKLLHIRSR